MRRKTKTNAAIGILVLASLTSCSTNESGGKEEIGKSVGPSPTSVSQSAVEPTLPLDAYLLSPADIDTITQAREEIVARCMSNLGFPYKKVEKESPLKSANGRRYGLTDAELAAQHGYHLPVAKQTPVLYPQTAQRLLKGEVTTFKGKKVPNGGCLGLAQQKLGEVNLQESLEVAQRLNFESYETTRGNSTVSEVNSRWSDCMKEEGHDYSDPLSAINDDQFKTPKANGHEQDVALADVRCKKKTGVIEVWSSVEGEYQQSLIRQNVGALQKGGSAKRETLRVAMQVLS